MIIKTEPSHRQALQDILEKSGQFDEESLLFVMDTLQVHLDNPGEEIWLTACDQTPVGFAYCAPEPVASGTWNLLMLWTKEGYEGKGHGKALVTEVEKILKEKQARLLIVETSQLPDFATAREFYDKQGFTLEAEVKNFFAQGDNKLIYTKPLN